MKLTKSQVRVTAHLLKLSIEIVIVGLCTVPFVDSFVRDCNAQPIPAAAEQVGHSIIRGRVIFADNRRPVRRALVMLYKNLNHPPVRTTAASVRGQYRFANLPAGSYFLVAHTPGVLSPASAFEVSDFGVQTSAGEDVRELVTVDGKNEIQRELQAIQSGTISGTINYSDKEPVLRARVLLFRRSGERILPFFTDPVFTNDRGMYRIDGLQPGDYFVGVTENVAPHRLAAVPMGATTAYYPGVNRISEAKAIKVQAGVASTNSNITLSDEELRSVSGVVKWRHNGEPIAQTELMLRRKDEPAVEVPFWTLMDDITAPGSDNFDNMMRDLAIVTTAIGAFIRTGTDEKGRWTFRDLAPGTYTITTHAALRSKTPEPKKGDDGREEDTNELMLGSPLVSRQVEVVITNQDVAGFTIELSEGSRILGSVSSENSQTPVVGISLQQPGSSDLLAQHPRSSNQNGTFVIEGVESGDVRLDVYTGSRDDLYVKSITGQGVDLMRNPLRVVEGSEITGVQITLAVGRATLSGRLLSTDGSPAAGGGLLLVPADPRLSHLRSTQVFKVADPAGEFSLSCAPGDYIILTWAAGRRPIQSFGEFASSPPPGARRISLQPSEQKKIDLLVPSTN